MNGHFVRTAALLALALVFTAGLTFATVELPHVADELLQSTVRTPGGDSHADVVARLKTDLFMAHYHVRTVGYVVFFVLVGLIAVGFATERTGLATLGAVGVMLPVFAQFASVMFFLAGLGLLNAAWLPVLDISWELQHWGRVVDAPGDLVRWLLGLAGVHSPWPTALLFIGGGILAFLLGVYAWLSARARGKAVADSWVYRVSRHPQYLGWILWTYGAYVLLQRAQYPRRSWGIGASLPWLISTMVIVGVAMLEELDMRQRHGDAYEAYRRTAPFLFPLPHFVERAFALPFRLLFGKARPERRREIAVVLAGYTAVLVGISVVFYAGGLEAARARFASAEDRVAAVQDLATRAREETNWRRRYSLLGQMASFGDPAVDPLLGLLEEDDPQLKAWAAEMLGRVPSERSVPALSAALADPDENLRGRAGAALGAVGNAEAVRALLPLLDDSVPFVRSTALAGLARAGAPEVLVHAPEFLASSEAWIRVGAVQAVGTLGLGEGVPLLSELLQDESAWVRREVVVALLRTGSSAALPALRRALSDEDWEARVYAAEALERLSADR